MVAIPAAVHGLPAVEAACAQATAEGVHSSDVIINILARQRDPGTGGDHPHAGCAEASACAARRLRPKRPRHEHMIMERTEVLDMMRQLKLFGMKNAYGEILATALKRQHELQRFAGDLLKAEIFEKPARSIKYQLTIAKLPLAKDVDGFEVKGIPINESVCRSAASPAGGSLRDGA